MIAAYHHCGEDNCRHIAYGMVEEDQAAGICHDDDDLLILAFPTHFDRAA